MQRHGILLTFYNAQRTVNMRRECINKVNGLWFGFSNLAFRTKSDPRKKHKSAGASPLLATELQLQSHQDCPLNPNVLV